MSYYNYPDHGLKGDFGPVERVSDDQYIQARKDREMEIWMNEDDLRESIQENLSSKYIEKAQEIIKMSQEKHNAIELGILMAEAQVILIEDVNAYIEEQARQDIDAKGDEI